MATQNNTPVTAEMIRSAVDFGPDEMRARLSAAADVFDWLETLFGQIGALTKEVNSAVQIQRLAAMGEYLACEYAENTGRAAEKIEEAMQAETSDVSVIKAKV